MRNTDRLNISSPSLIEAYNLSWVLRRQLITCRHWPSIGDEVAVLTAPTGFERGLLTYRDFHLLDGTDLDGPPLISAVSEWLLMDVRSRRLRPIPNRIAALAQDLAPAAAHLDKPTRKLAPPTAPTEQREIKIRYGMLDFNDHLTNPVYPELMLEPLGKTFLLDHLPTEIDVDFRAEARYGDSVTATASKEEGHTRHALRRGEALLSVMQVNWAPLTG